MSQVKHTPGPWTIDAVMSEALHDICLGYLIPNAGNPILVASVYSDDEGRPGDISLIAAEANARLMAASPDLLTVCIENVQDGQCAVETNGPHPECICWYCKTCAAIKLAVG